MYRISIINVSMPHVLNVSMLLLFLFTFVQSHSNTILLRNQIPNRKQIRMPIISLGTAGYNNTVVEASIIEAFSLGFKAIHTAYDYYNLDGVSAALSQLPRSDLFVTAMTSPCIHTAGNPKRNVTDPTACTQLTISEVNATFSELNIEYIDLLLLHGPSEPFNFTNGCDAQINALNVAQWRAYNYFLKIGKVRSIGVSNFCPSCLKGLKGLEGLNDGVPLPVPSVNQIQWHVGMGKDPEGLMSYCKSQNIVVQAYSPLAGGQVVTDPLCNKVGVKYNKTGANVGLKWVVQHENTAVVVKASQKEYLMEDIEVFNWKLDLQDVNVLNAASVPHGQNGGRPSWGCAENSEKNKNSNTGWRFMHAYPKHLLVHKVQDHSVAINGDLTEFTLNNISFVDITHHANTSLNIVPSYYQAQVALLYDNSYLYVASKLKDPYTAGNVAMKHNGPEVPYHDNDFEVFIDVSGSTEFYKEFEMNVNNATYDVNWGVPDQAGLSCDGSVNRTSPYLPTCVNTSSPFYSGTWTMYDNSSRKEGLRTATSATSLDILNASATWNVEIAFPLRSTENHGGLLDTDTLLSETNSFYDFSRFDPSKKMEKMPLYWSADFARTVHPRKFIAKDGSFVYCPFNNCSFAKINNAVNVSRSKPNAAECIELQKQDPTMLGADPSYGCYWEWVLNNLGSNAYMHRPLQYAFLEFKDEKDDGKECGNIAFPTRHLLRIIHSFMSHYKSVTKTYTTLTENLISECNNYCSITDLNDLKYAVTETDVFAINILVEKNATVLNTTCVNRPCYTATVSMKVPGSDDSFEVVGTINDNQRVRIERKGGDGKRCLF